MARVSGNSSLNFTGEFDIKDILENQRRVTQGFMDMKQASESALSPAAGGSSSLRQQNLATQQALRESRLELERLKQEEQQLINQQAALGVSTADLTRRYNENRLAQQELRIAAQQARNSQTAANGSYREAQLRLTALGREIRETAGGFNNLGAAQRARINEYRQLNAQLTEFDRGLGNNQRNVGNYRNALNGIGSNLAGLAAGYFSAFTALAGISKVIRTNAELSDSFADVQRTAGLTGIEVNNLSEQLKKIDTRTSLKGLFDIAIVGGQLGIAKDQLGGFTKAVDELAVTLSGELKGGAEGIAKSLGVLDNVFKVTASNSGDVEKSYNQIGSAILNLGQSGLATGDFLADFGERVGGVAKQAGLSLPVILSYGAVLQENGVSAEVAGTAFKRLISALASNSGKFFQVAKFADANLTLKEFNKIINTDTKKALDLFFAGINKGGASTIAFSSILKSLKISGAGASQTVSALSNNTQELEGHIKEATKAFDDATLSAEQFDIKNNTLAGSIDKLGKAFENSTNSGVIAGFFKPIIDFITEGIKGLDLLASKIKGTQSAADDKLVAANRGKFNIASDDPKERAELQAARDRVRKRNVDALKDEVKAVGASTADIIAAGKSEIELRKLITGEIYKQGEAQKRLNNNLKFITDPKNVGAPLDAQIAKTNKLRIAYAKQIAVVEQLKSKLPKAEVAARSNAEAPNLKDDKKTESRLQSDLNARNELQRKIDEINKNAVRKQVNADDAEVQSVSDKYRKIEFEIEKFNRRNKSGLKLTTSGLSTSEQAEIEAVQFKQSNKRLKDQLSSQTKDFEDFENYKLKFGIEAANKRYQTEFTTAEAYAQKLEDLQTKTLNEIGDPSKATEAQKEQLAIIADEIVKFSEKRKQIDNSIYSNAYDATKSYIDKALDLEKQFERDKLALASKGQATPERIAILKREMDERKRALNQTNADEESGFSMLMERYNELTRDQLLKSLEATKQSYRDKYALGLLTAKQLEDSLAPINSEIDKLIGNNAFNKITGAIKNYKKALDDAKGDKGAMGVVKAQKELDYAIVEGANQINSALSDVSGLLGELGIGGQELQDVFKGVSGVVSGAAEIAKGDPISVITGSIKILTSVVGLFNTKDKKIQKQIDAYKKDLESLGKSFAILERQVSRTAGVDVYSIQQQQIANLQQQQQKLIDMRNAESDKKKSDQGKIDELNNQIDGIPDKIQDIQDSISQNLIQGTFKELSNSLADALTSAFSAGEDGIDAMNKTFDQFIANALKNAYKLAFLEPLVKQFTDDLTAYAKANNNSVVGFDFESYRSILQQGGKDFNDALAETEKYFKDLGVDKNAPKDNTLQGSIKASLTEETGSILAGAFNGMRLSLLNIEGIIRPMGANQLLMVNLAQQNLNEVMMIQQNTYRTANNTDQLSRLEAVEDQLGVIAKNTGDTLGVQLRAAGRFNY